ncbi:MAG: ketol-acid reductoisomerase [Phycisphaerales bacterium]|nr:ketol-acid reductoisomerase [Phycisphaerales bacterium]
MSKATIIPKTEADVAKLASQTVAVLGYGAQGHAHALNLRDSGVNVIVAQRADGAEGSANPRYEQARRDGFEPAPIADAVSRSDLLIVGLPDDAAPGIYEREIRPNLRAGQALGFLHGFVIHYGRIAPPGDVDVILVAPKGQGRGVRREYEAGRGVVSLIAVAQDASGAARDRALGWAGGIGSGRAGVIETTFADETETDLFGEQAVLCGGLSAMILAAFDTLVDAGYPPELAYFECCHEAKLVTDLIHDGGIAFMRERISTTARYGDVTRGPRLVDDVIRDRMKDVLSEIRSGAFAREFLEDSANGGARSKALCDAERGHAIEEVGARLREMMWGRSRPE